MGTFGAGESIGWHDSTDISQVTTQPISERYLEQILTGLRRDGIVQSQRSAKGGYVLVRKP